MFLNKTKDTQTQSFCTPCDPLTNIPYYKYWTIRNRRKRTLEKEGRDPECMVGWGIVWNRVIVNDAGFSLIAWKELAHDHYSGRPPIDGHIPHRLMVTCIHKAHSSSRSLSVDLVESKLRTENFPFVCFDCLLQRTDDGIKGIINEERTWLTVSDVSYP